MASAQAVKAELRVAFAAWHVRKAAELLRIEPRRGRPTNLERALAVTRRVLEEAFAQLDRKRQRSGGAEP